MNFQHIRADTGQSLTSSETAKMLPHAMSRLTNLFSVGQASLPAGSGGIPAASRALRAGMTGEPAAKMAAYMCVRNAKHMPPDEAAALARSWNEFRRRIDLRIEKDVEI